MVDKNGFIIVSKIKPRVKFINYKKLDEISIHTR